MGITTNPTDILIIVDLQNDYRPDGALPTADGDRIVPVVNAVARHFENIVLTQGWHAPGHMSFASTHGKQPMETIETPHGTQVLWPDHAVQGTRGAEFHPDLDVPNAQLIVRKGYSRDVDGSSAFRMTDRSVRTGLSGYLREREIRHVFIAGCTIDHCVGGLAIDAIADGFETYIIDDATASIDPAGSALEAWNTLEAAGVTRVSSADFG